MSDHPSLIRKVARVLLVSEQEKVLLLRGGDPTKQSAHWWFTPGGGVAEGESLQQAASRELWEETGLSYEFIGEPIWERVASFEFMNQHYHQHESFFVARVPEFSPQATYLSEVEQVSFSGWHWWSLEELRQTKDVYYPAELADRFSDLIAPPSDLPVLLKEERIELPK